MTRYEHAGNAPDAALAGGLAAGGLSFTVNDGTGYPTGAVGPFWIVVDPGTASEEKLLCTDRVGTVFTIDPAGRGGDGTADTDHSDGAVVRHCFTATEADEFNAHAEATTDVHGVTGALAADADLDQEIADRAAADSTLQGNIDTEAADRAAADATLQTNIDTEAATRSSADTALQGNIDTEAATRSDADDALDTRLDTLENSTWVTSGFTAHSGWSITTAKYLLRGGMCALSLVLSRTGTDITASGNENITPDIDLFDSGNPIPSAARPSVTWTGAYDKDGTGHGQYQIGTGGVVSILSLTDGATITSGDVVRITTVYPVV